MAPLQRAIAVVVPSGRGVLVSSPRPLRLGVDHLVSFAGGEPVRLAGAGLYFECFHNFRILKAAADQRIYSVVSTGYSYTLFDQGRRELVVYHDHLYGSSWCTYPHLHAETATGIISEKVHLITERVTLAAVIRMLIEDPAIPVVSLRPDWARVLEANGERNAFV